MDSPIKWHGGKHYLAGRIVGLMPPHKHYVEPYAGSLAVLFARDPCESRLLVPPEKGVSEVANDVDRHLVNFWLILSNHDAFPDFVLEAQKIPFSEEHFGHALRKLNEPCAALMPESGKVCLGCALAFFVAARQSLAGRMKSFAPMSRRRTRRGMNEQASAWWNAVEGLEEVYHRLKRVVVFCRPALEVIVGEDSPDTLFYLDPPYLGETRASPKVYRHEMSVDDHLTLLNQIKGLKGKVMISHYPCEMYDQLLGLWRRHEFTLANHAAGGQEKKTMTEVVWTNF